MMRLHEFWFGDIEVTFPYYENQIRRWFSRDDHFDRICRKQFAPQLENDFYIPEIPRDYLELILLLDQIPRNSFRGSQRSFAFDHFAQKLALTALGTKFEFELSLPERIFLYLPLQHAEDIELQNISVEKFFELHRLAPPEIRAWTQLGVDKAISHRKTIQDYGHFPWRKDFSRASILP